MNEQTEVNAVLSLWKEKCENVERTVKLDSSCLYVDQRINVDSCFNFRIILVFEKLLPVV